MSLRRLTLLAAVIALGLGGCASNPAPPDTGEAPLTYLATLPEPSDIVPQARYDGSLGLTEAGCFGVTISEGVIPAIFPAETTILPSGTGISGPYGEIQLGESFSASSGEFAREQESGASIPSQCEADRMTLVFPN
jgi:hypothetical protein